MSEKKSKITVLVPIEVKEEAEEVLHGIGINMTTMIELLLRQVIYTQGLPFEVKLPPLRIIEHDLTHHQGRIDKLLDRSCKQLERGEIEYIDACRAVLFTQEAIRDFGRIDDHYDILKEGADELNEKQIRIAAAINRLTHHPARHHTYARWRKFGHMISMMVHSGYCVFYISENWRDLGPEIVVLRIIY